VRFGSSGNSPCNSDTDGDGLSDGDEALIYGTDPLVADRPDDVEDLLSGRSWNNVCASPPGNVILSFMV
jgi:hypothetical protein